MTVSEKLLEGRFIRAAIDRDLDTLNACLAERCDVNFQDVLGRTALIYAAYYGYQQVVSALLAHGACADPQDRWGVTALMWAARRGHSDVVSTLLAHGAAVDLQDERDKTAVDLAIKEGHNAIAAAIQAEVEKRALTKTAALTTHQPKRVKL